MDWSAMKPSDNAKAASMYRSVGAAETDDKCDIENLNSKQMRGMRKAITRNKSDVAVHDEL
jgi:hypothetical protein